VREGFGSSGAQGTGYCTWRFFRRAGGKKSVSFASYLCNFLAFAAVVDLSLKARTGMGILQESKLPRIFSCVFNCNGVFGVYPLFVPRVADLSMSDRSFRSSVYCVSGSACRRFERF